MPVDIFGHTYVGSSQRIVSGGVTLSQINNTFLRRDGANTAIGDVNLEFHKLINVKDPTNAQEAATKNYVDTEKVSKSGENISGDIIMLLHDDPVRTFGVSDINTGQSVSLLLGNVDNQIRHNFGHPLKIAAAHGIKVTCPAAEVCQIGTQDDASTRYFKNIVMDNNFIKGLHDPVGEADAATKLYVDTRGVKNSVGYVPNLTSNVNKTGFAVSASSELTKSEAFNVFNSSGTEWLSAEDISFWIEIKFPDPVRIHKISLRGVLTGTIRNWILQASNDDHVWDNIYDNYLDSGSTSSCIDHSQLIIEVDSLHKYSTYRIWVNNTEGERPGLSHWQLYTVDTLV